MNNMSDDDMQDGWGYDAEDQIQQDDFVEDDDATPPMDLLQEDSHLPRSRSLAASLDPLDKLTSASWYSSTTLFDYAEASKAEKNGTLQLILDLQRRMRDEGPSMEHAKHRSRAPSPDLLQGHRHKKACAQTSSSPEPQHFGASRLRSNSVSYVQDCLYMAPPPSERGHAADDDEDDALLKCKKRLERLDKLSRAIDVSLCVWFL
jgi:hypothetical protein